MITIARVIDQKYIISEIKFWIFIGKINIKHQKKLEERETWKTLEIEKEHKYEF